MMRNRFTDYRGYFRSVLFLVLSLSGYANNDRQSGLIATGRASDAEAVLHHVS